MSSYRPIADKWFLGRPKVKYYGAYPNGFLERARPLVAMPWNPVLHVCGGKVREYPNWKKLCSQDQTLDLDLALKPDFLQDCREPLPLRHCMELTCPTCQWASNGNGDAVAGAGSHLWPAILIDRPYTEADADHYTPGREFLPGCTALFRHCLTHVRVGGRVGMLDYKAPRPKQDTAKYLVAASVVTGFDNNVREFSVFERLK